MPCSTEPRHHRETNPMMQTRPLGTARAPWQPGQAAATAPHAGSCTCATHTGRCSNPALRAQPHDKFTLQPSVMPSCGRLHIVCPAHNKGAPRHYSSSTALNTIRGAYLCRVCGAPQPVGWHQTMRRTWADNNSWLQMQLQAKGSAGNMRHCKQARKSTRCAAVTELPIHQPTKDWGMYAKRDQWIRPMMAWQSRHADAAVHPSAGAPMLWATQAHQVIQARMNETTQQPLLP